MEMVAEAYKAKSVPKSDWIQKLENLLTTLKIYRDVENAAMERICTILESKEIVISTENRAFFQSFCPISFFI